MTRAPQDLRPELPRFKLDDEGKLRVDERQLSQHSGQLTILNVIGSVLRKQRRFIVTHAPRVLASAQRMLKHIRLPSALQPLPNFRSLPRRTVSILAVAAVIASTGFIWHARSTSGSGGNVQGAATAKAPTPGTPDFSTVAPSGKSIKNLGGWYRVSPPNRDPVYAFVDHIGKTEITVSEQPLPKNFQSDTAQQISNLATSFGANQKLTSDTVTAYIGTSARGPQSVILTERNLLILIKSTDRLSNDQWIAYLATLQ